MNPLPPLPLRPARRATLGLAAALCAALLLPAPRAAGQDDYQEWLKKQKQEFEDFKTREDRDFTEFLEKEWREFQVFKGVPADTRPKPEHLPAAPKPERKKELAPTPPAKVRQVPAPPPQEPPPPPPPEVPPNLRSVDIDFYGAPWTLVYDPAVRLTVGTPVDNKSIAAFFEALAKAPCEDLAAQVSARRSRMHLNDWGYCRLLDAAAAAIYGDRTNERYLFVWFMLLKGGYGARVGYADGRVVLLLPTRGSLYSIPYFTLGAEKKRYYGVQLAPRDPAVSMNLFVYEQDYPGATKALDFRAESFPAFPDSTRSRTLRFSYAGKAYDVAARFNLEAVRYYEYHPQVEYPIYFTAAVSPEAAQSLLGALRPIVQGKTEAEAANILLRFVQTAFRYKTDDDQFGREKPLFPDETLSYPYSDCEDRAVLYAYLVRSLLGLEVVGLDYPGHLATAVRFSARVPGDSVQSGGKTFVVCDPTYENADIGMTMPIVKQHTPTVIAIR